MLRHSQRQWGRGAGLLPFGYVDLHPEDATRGQPTAIVTPDGTERPGAWVAEITDMPDLTPCPKGIRLIVRKERPYPGAQLRFTDIDGNHLTCFMPYSVQACLLYRRGPWARQPQAVTEKISSDG